MILRIILPCLGMIFTSLFTFCQQDSLTGNEIIISGNIPGSRNDTLELHVYRDFKDITFDHPIYTALTNKGGSFNFHIANIPEIGGRISLLINEREHGYTELTNKATPVEAGDSLFLHIDKLDWESYKVTYSGKGSAKFICRQEIYAIDKDQQIQITKDPHDDYVTLKKINDQFNSIIQKKLDVLSGYSHQISLPILKILEADIIGSERLACLFTSANTFRRMDSAALSLDSRLYFENMGNADAFNEYAFYSSRYLDFLLNKVSMNMAIQKKSYNYSLLDVYRKIIPLYTGEIRDRMLINLFFFGNRYQVGLRAETMDSLMQDAFHVIEDSALKSILITELGNKSKGTKAFDFTLPDNRGNLVSLAQFKNKVVLIDFWFTGCGGCSTYSYWLEKKVYPFFEGNPNIIFMSISGDKDRKTWLASIKSGKYTRASNVNLYTEGMGFEHPLTKYYGFYGGPYSLLIDRQGNIFCGNPPTVDMNFLIKLMEEALKN